MSKTVRNSASRDGRTYYHGYKPLHTLMYIPKNNSSALYKRYGAAHDSWQDSFDGHKTQVIMRKKCVRILRQKLKSESRRIVKQELQEQF